MDAKEFAGKDQIIDKRKKALDLEHDENICNRKGEKAIREHKKIVKKTRNPNFKMSTHNDERRAPDSRTLKKPINEIITSPSDNSEWESF